MNDRELLEAAAKAVGHEIDPIDAMHEPEDLCAWNPLDDDGDALRLAVRLLLEVDVCQTGIAVRTPPGHKVLVDARQEPDIYKATRLAIVRAAAAMCKEGQPA